MSVDRMTREDVPPAVLEHPTMRAALARRDLKTVYQRLNAAGLSYRTLASLTGQAPSEIYTVLHKGRQVSSYDVLVRIADGLGMTRAQLGVSYGEKSSPARRRPVRKEVTEATKRRVLIAAAMLTGLDPTPLGEAPQLPLPVGQKLPTQVSISHVHAVRSVTEQLRGLARYYGGQGDLFNAAAAAYTRYMHVPTTDVIRAQLAAALAELHTEAGWFCYDSGLDGSGHFTRALELGKHGRDAHAAANAAWNAGGTLVLTGHPNDALKLFQLGRLHLGGFRPRSDAPATRQADDPRIPALATRLLLQSATAYAVMEGRREATQCLAEAHDGWEPPDAFEHGEADLETAVVQLHLGQLDAAEQFAASAVSSYGTGHRTGRTMAELLRAEIHIRAGDSQGVALAQHAITAVSTLHSAAARRERLLPLATALDTRPSPDTRDLARTARGLATDVPRA